MGAKKSPKTGGRKKGTPNVRSLELAERAKKMGVDPFTVLLSFVKADWAGLGYKSETTTSFTPQGIEIEEYVITPELRVLAAKEACQYLYPKRKALEIEDNREEAPTRFILHWADENEDADVRASKKNTASKADQ